MLSKSEILGLIADGRASYVVEQLNLCVENAVDDAEKSRLYCLLGDVYYKLGDWKEAIQHYEEACHYDECPVAAEKLKMVHNILAFYNKDVYGQ